MTVSPASEVDRVALQLTISPGDRGGQQTLAMATLISPTEALTPYHVLHSLGPTSELTVRLRNTDASRVSVVATDPAADLALLRAQSTFPFSSQRVADRVPESDEAWTSFLMLPSLTAGAAVAGTVLGHSTVDGIEHLTLSVSSGAPSPAGSSGGPVVVEGAIVGILARASADGGIWHALPVTSAAIARLRSRAVQSPRAADIDGGFDPRASFARLSPSAVAAFSHADGMRLQNRQDKVHMEHLVMGLYLKEDGPAKELFTAAGITTQLALQEILNTVTDFDLPGSYEPSELSAMPPVSGHVKEALEHAQRIAGPTASSRVRSRHVLYGALSVDQCEVIKALVGRGVSRDRITLTDMSSVAPGIPIVGADSDAPSGDDQLGLETEIDALSALVASQSTKTPMSIGLFGHWGSGKSFFMQKMDARIRVFRDSATAERDSPYCKGIIQLWFNAWHYIDRSLWASLGAEIFEGLAHGLTEVETRQAGPKLEDERTKLLVKRADAEAQRLRAEEVAAKSTADLNVQTREIARIASQTDREIESSLGTKAIVEEVLAVASSQREVKTALDSAAEKLGWAELNERSEAAGRQVKEFLSLASYWQSLVATLRSPGGARWWIAAAAVAAVAIVLSPWFIPAASILGGAAQRIISALFAFGLVATPVLRAAHQVTALVRSARDAMQRRIDDERRADLDAAERSRAEAEEKANADLQELERRRRAVDTIDQQLEAIKPARQIVDFIRKRNQSTEYTQHFGVIARARQDFEELTRLMQLVRDQPTADAPFTPVDRIVLYIDDLDRCPEDKVFEVLQAVHLLLAFPLFVVVVGVDPRWLFHSLRTRLRALAGQFYDSNGDEEQYRGWESTPLNYLEKIFQIPFTLRPMGDIGYKRMIDELTVPSTLKESAHRSPPTAETTTKTASAPSGVAVDPERAVEVPAVVVPADANVTRQTATELNEKTKPQEAKQAHARLELSSWETAHMKRLFPLIPTPRATKRFVNVYRLLRGITAGEQRRALIGNESDGGYRPALLLLAMVTGYPVEATEVMRELLERLAQKDCPPKGWTLLDAIRASHEPVGRQAARRRSKRSTTASQPSALTPTENEEPVSNDEQWDEMFEKLKEVRKLTGDSLTSKAMGEWAPLVARYSFASGRLLVSDPKLAAESEQVH